MAIGHWYPMAGSYLHLWIRLFFGREQQRKEVAQIFISEGIRFRGAVAAYRQSILFRRFRAQAIGAAGYCVLGPSHFGGCRANSGTKLIDQLDIVVECGLGINVFEIVGKFGDHAVRRGIGNPSDSLGQMSFAWKHFGTDAMNIVEIELKI